MDSTPRPRVLPTLRHALRVRCPVCGVGRVFDQHRFHVEPHCTHCGWRFERGPGHWLGGSEVNMLLAFPAGIGAAVLAGSAFGFAWWTAFFGAGVAMLVSLGFYQRGRCVFYAVDYLLDPEPEHGPWGFDRDRGPELPRDPDPGSPRTERPDQPDDPWIIPGTRPRTPARAAAAHPDDRDPAGRTSRRTNDRT